MLGMRTLDSVEIANKRVLLRVDLNVPLQNERVIDDTRVKRIVPTVQELIAQDARVILLSHLGRPKGKPTSELSLRPIVDVLAKELAATPVKFVDDIVGERAAAAVAKLGNGEVLLLENLRFDPREEANDMSFAEGLASFGDVYVDDAFSCAHRAHASIDALARLLPCAAGRELARELDVLESTLTDPDRPLAAIIGGAKVSTKLGVLQHLAAKVDTLIIGGGMANTFLKARGVEVGRSLCEDDCLEMAGIVEKALGDHDGTIVLPHDVVVAARLEPNVTSEIIPADRVPPDAMILDIGPESVARIANELSSCRTLVWNGPLGAFEIPPFDAGTIGVCRAVATQTVAGQLRSVAGGGETLAAINQAGVASDLTYLSAAGGAFLEWLEGRKLPGVAVLCG